jgi:thymidylate kinase
LLPKLQSIGPATVRAALHRRRGELVILDRYGDDFAEADGVGLKRRLARSTIGALLGLVNPDLVIVLDAPAAVMHQRKGEHTPEELAHRRRHYLELAKRRAGVAVIDATAPPDQVLATASTQVWRRWSSRTSA